MPAPLQTMADAIRVLSMDAVEQASNGHPGMPMGMADVATVLWTKFLKYDATKPDWADRDRFVLSGGHGSMLLYSLLHLSGFKAVSMDELRTLRQWGSKTPGHPEVGHTPGVEDPTPKATPGTPGLYMCPTTLRPHASGRASMFGRGAPGGLREVHACPISLLPEASGRYTLGRRICTEKRRGRPGVRGPRCRRLSGLVMPHRSRPQLGVQLGQALGEGRAAGPRFVSQGRQAGLFGHHHGAGRGPVGLGFGA